MSTASDSALPIVPPQEELTTTPAEFDRSTDRESRSVPDPPTFRAGDLVTVNRVKVNLRAWMSTAATVTGELKRRKTARLLSDPDFSCGAWWVKLRPTGSRTHAYMAVRYLELIEPAPIRETEAPPAPTPTDPASRQLGDDVVSIMQVNLRAQPGRAGGIQQVIKPNQHGIVLSSPMQVGAEEWMEVRFPTGSGWMASRFSRLLASGENWIEVDLTNQTLTAWEDAVPVGASPISSGKPGFSTPTGVFSISTKYPARRTIAWVRDEEWDIPGVPWVMVFREGGFYIHGVYWHNDFGSAVSHGCVTLPVPFAEWLYGWSPSGTRIWIHD